MGRLENRVEKKLCDGVVKRLKGKTFKLVGIPGIPDRLVILPGGRIYFIEIKTVFGVVSEKQSRFIKMLLDLGCNALVLRGEHEVDKWLRGIQ